MNFKFKKEKLFFISLFVVLGFIALQIPINQLAGSRVKFTLFDLLAPISGAIIGTPLGVISVLAIQIVNLLIHGASAIEKGSIIRLFPTLFAVWFFAKKDGRQLLIPILAMISFNLNPVGRSVWFYSLFWLMPLITYPFKERFLLLRSLGSTFTAHAVGGAIWIWAFNLPPNVWVSLIPVVILERGLFALGISASYIVFNNLLAVLTKQKILTNAFSLDKKYLLRFLK